MIRIGIDLGGTKIEAIALDDSGSTLVRRRVDTPQNDYGAIVQSITSLVVSIEKEQGTNARVGVATPGAISPTSGLLRNSNSVCLNNKPLDKDLAAALSRPIRLANDADCFALSEATDGAAVGAYSVFGVIVGTGIGGGVVIDGRLLHGPNAIAGEWGHNPLPWPADEERPGLDCYCGKKGCIETFLSGPGLSIDHKFHAGEDLTAIEIIERAGQGDIKAECTLQRYEDRMARALASVINVIDPEVIVLGGGVSNISRLYVNVPGLWGRYVFSDHASTRLVQARHGDSSGVRGAAWLWPCKY
ncbi:MAG: ROK family protein [Gammaproteobacteria bacterium]|nr:ROK family protein [Gammaproteobacteria bacterium]